MIPLITSPSPLATLQPLQDPFFNDVSLLLKFQGQNGGTTFLDHSRNQLKVDPFGAASLSNAVTRYGSTSFYQNGTDGSYLRIQNSQSALTLGAGDFTLEAWVYPVVLPVTYPPYIPFIDTRTSVTYQAYACGLFSISGTLRPDILWGNYTGNRITATTTSTPVGQWSHVAFVRQAGVIRMYVNGVEDATTATVSSAILATDATAWIGALKDPVVPTAYFAEMRITQRIARYGRSFPVPCPFPIS